MIGLNREPSGAASVQLTSRAASTLGPGAAQDPERRSIMLYWALIFLVVAIVAGIFGFGGIAATASSIAQVLFFIFLVLFIISLFFGWRGGAFGP
jgi:uncharacterized membrane protein YtjA (UPF0391 family)